MILNAVTKVMAFSDFAPKVKTTFYFPVYGCTCPNQLSTTKTLIALGSVLGHGLYISALKHARKLKFLMCSYLRHKCKL